MSRSRQRNDLTLIGMPSHIFSRYRRWLKSILARSKYLRNIPLKYIEVSVMLIAGFNSYYLLVHHTEVVSFFQHQFLVLLEKVCIIAGIAGILVYTEFFQEILAKKFTLMNRLLTILTFGAISIFGTYTGLEIFGAIVNVRDLAPMVAGLTGGPLIGTFAGLIGAAHRYTLGGPTCFPCSLATVLAGFVGGMTYIFIGRRFISVTGAVILAVIMETVHMLLALFLTSPYTYAETIVSAVAIPITVSNAFGMFVFAQIISHHISTLHKTKTIFDDSDDKKMQDYQMQAADKIQHAFISDSIPAIHGLDIATFRMPGKMGLVDYYDFRIIADKMLSLSVVDIPGNSFKSSAEMAILHTILRIESGASPNPEGVIKRVNSQFRNDEHADHISLLYGIMDLNTMTFTYVNAGLTNPLLIGNGQQMILKTDAKIGTLEEKNIKDHEIKLRRGHVLFIHTDGVSHTGIPHDWDNDIAILIEKHMGSSAATILSAVKDFIASYRSDNVRAEDMAMVLVKIL